MFHAMLLKIVDQRERERERERERGERQATRSSKHYGGVKKLS